jgi:hypothetical protein
MPNEIHSYNEFQHQIHKALRIQHPEWAEPNGECPTCESHEYSPGRITRSQSALNRGENASIMLSELRRRLVGSTSTMK